MNNAAKKSQSYGAIAGGIGTGIGLAFGVPGLGQVTSLIGSKIGERIGKPEDLTDQYNKKYTIMKNGGKLIGDIDFAKYKGNSHSKGGINVDELGVPTNDPNSNIEVEGEETKVSIDGEDYIFSKQLKL